VQDICALSVGGSPPEAEKCLTFAGCHHEDVPDGRPGGHSEIRFLCRYRNGFVPIFGPCLQRLSIPVGDYVDGSLDAVGTRLASVGRFEVSKLTPHCVAGARQCYRPREIPRQFLHKVHRVALVEKMKFPGCDCVYYQFPLNELPTDYVVPVLTRHTRRDVQPRHGNAFSPKTLRVQLG
jgi:hypothetical protein